MHATASRVFSIVLVACCASGCMLEPSYGTELKTNSSVRFSGYFPSTSAAIEIQSAASPDGPFATFATAFPRRRGVVLNGATWFPWSVNAVVPQWTATACGNQHAFVRARDSVSGRLLSTFDRPEESAEPVGIDCLTTAYQETGSELTALQACQSEHSPVVELLAGTATYSGHVVISSQAEADAYACYTTIRGSLTIADDSDELFIKLPHLRRVTASLNVVYSRGGSPNITFHPPIRRVGLARLSQVGRDVSLSYPGTASDDIVIDFGLEALDSVGRHVTISLTTFNTDASGFDSLTFRATSPRRWRTTRVSPDSCPRSHASTATRRSMA